MGLRCKRCGSEEHVKNGLMRTKQRYLCKDCGLNFTDTPPRGKPLALKAAAVLLYVSGLSMHRTAQLLGVSTPTIQAWLEPFAAAYAQKPEPEGRAVVIELDEMWPDLKKAKQVCTACPTDAVQSRPVLERSSNFSIRGVGNTSLLRSAK